MYTVVYKNRRNLARYVLDSLLNFFNLKLVESFMDRVDYEASLQQ